MATTHEIVIDRAGIVRAEALIRPHVRETPVIHVDAADFGLPVAGQLCLKLESLQHSGSFKVRGAFTNLLSRELPPAGVVAASGGNHGAAVAFAAQRLGVPAKIFVPCVASPAKLEQIRMYGADLTITGDRYSDALAASLDWEQETGAVSVHAFDQVETLLGQGTLGAELERQAPNVQTIVVAVGGGGLIGGLASWYRGSTRLIGVEPTEAPTMSRALRAGRPVDAPTGGIAADSLAPKRIGNLVYPIVEANVDEVLLVTDDEIRTAQEMLWRVLRVVAEPGGAAALAAILAGQYRPSPDEQVAIVICGGNTTAVDFNR